MPLLLTGCLLILLSTTGLPMVPLLLLGGGCLWLGWDIGNRVPASSSVSNDPAKKIVGPISTANHPSRGGETAPAVTSTAFAVPDVEMLTLELGVGLLRLVDVSRGGRLMEEISKLRQTVLDELGFVVPKILVRDAVELDPREYRIRLRDIPVAQGTAYHDAVMAFDEGTAERTLDGIDTRHPTTGLAAKWIDPSKIDEAHRAGLRVLNPQQVIAEHLHDVIRHHAAELLTRGQLYGLLDQCRDVNRKLVEETIPGIVSVPRLHQVLRGLLSEQVPIRDLQSVLESLSFTPPGTSLNRQIESGRRALARSICKRFRNSQFELRAFVLSPNCEGILLDSLDPIEGELRLQPAEMTQLHSECHRQFGHSSGASNAVVLMTSAPIRAALSRLMAQWFPAVNVLSREEVTRDTKLVVTGTIGLHLPAESSDLSHPVGATMEAAHE